MSVDGDGSEKDLVDTKGTAHGVGGGDPLKYEPPPPPELPPPPPPLQPSVPMYMRTRRGVMFIFISLFLFFISLLVIAGLNFHLASAIGEPTTVSLSVLSNVSTLEALATILLVVSAILAVLGIYECYNGRYEFGEEHATSVRFALFFLIGYLVVLAISVMAVLSAFSSFNAFLPPSVALALSVFQNFFLAFMLLYLLRHLGGALERDLLYVFAILEIAIPVIAYYAIRTIPFELSADTIFDLMKEYAIREAYTSLAHAGIMLLAVVPYWLVSKGLRDHGTALPRDRKGFIPRPARVAPYVRRFYHHPPTAIIVVLIVAAVVGASTFVDITVPSSGGDDDTSKKNKKKGPIYDLNQTGLMSLSDSNTLDEGDSQEYTLTFEGPVIWVTITLYWEDEGDLVLRTNQPDTFELVVVWPDGPWSDQTENPHGGVGAIDMGQEYPEDDPLTEEYISIEVTLVEAGDQTGPVGIGGSPLTVADNSNDYEILVQYMYYIVD